MGARVRGEGRIRIRIRIKINRNSHIPISALTLMKYPTKVNVNCMMPRVTLLCIFGSVRDCNKDSQYGKQSYVPERFKNNKEFCTTGIVASPFIVGCWLPQYLQGFNKPWQPGWCIHTVTYNRGTTSFWKERAKNTYVIFPFFCKCAMITMPSARDHPGLEKAYTALDYDGSFRNLRTF